LSLFFLCFATKEKEVTKKKKVRIADEVIILVYDYNLVGVNLLPFGINKSFLQYNKSKIE